MQRVDTPEMLVVHRAIRRETRLAAELVAKVGDGDRERVAVLGPHVAELLELVHHHHDGEDELLWPVLTGRAQLEADLIGRMEAQHNAIDELRRAAEPRLAAWRETAASETRDALADALADLADRLEEHMAEEEQYVLPLVADHLTVAEWERLGERGMQGIPRSRLLMVLGSLLEEADEAETAMFMAKLPAPARLLWKVSGRRRYGRQVALIRG